MTQQAGRELTLLDLAADLQWVRLLGWSDDDLRSVTVHEEATAGGGMINLSAFGGTALGVGGGTSADARSLPNMYVYESEAPPRLWQSLKEIVDQGGPSGYNTVRDSGEATFPPAGNSQ